MSVSVGDICAVCHSGSAAGCCVSRYEVEREELVHPVAQQQRWMTADLLLVYFFPGVLSESLYATRASVDCVVKKKRESCREVK